MKKNKNKKTKKQKNKKTKKQNFEDLSVCYIFEGRSLQ
jgi:hypothetical protein